MELFDGILTAVNAKRVKRAPGESVPTKPPSMARQTFARNLKAAREAVGLTQRALGDLAGVSQKHIWEIETTAKNVTLDTISALAEHLGKSEADLLTREKL